MAVDAAPARDDAELDRVLTQVRLQHPGVRVEVRSPTDEQLAAGDVPAGYREVTVSTARPGFYAVPLLGDGAAEVWRVGIDDMPGSGDLAGRYPTVEGAVLAAADQAQRDLSTPPRADRAPSVPWEVAAWSTRVRALCAQALRGDMSLNDAVAQTGPQAEQDHRDLRAAFAAMLDGLPHAPAPATPGARREPLLPLSEAVVGARAALTGDDLDSALANLYAADQMRRPLGLPGSEPPDHIAADLRRATDPTERSDRPARRDAERGDTAVSNMWRSDLTAAAQIEADAAAPVAGGPVDGPDDRGQVGSAGTRGPAPLRADELALVERVDPDAADALVASEAAGRSGAGGARADWSHRRPERAADQPTPDRVRSR